jgi:hypothetical protein
MKDLIELVASNPKAQSVAGTVLGVAQTRQPGRKVDVVVDFKLENLPE